jgi:hypothetical protein
MNFDEMRAEAHREIRGYMRRMDIDPTTRTADQAWAALGDIAKLHPRCIAAQWQRAAYNKYNLGITRQSDLFNQEWQRENTRRSKSETKAPVLATGALLENKTMATITPYQKSRIVRLVKQTCKGKRRTHRLQIRIPTYSQFADKQYKIIFDKRFSAEDGRYFTEAQIMASYVGSTAGATVIIYQMRFGLWEHVLDKNLAEL